MRNRARTIVILLVLTPLFFLVTHAIAYFLHEYCHSFMAWALGYKSNPLALDYGDSSIYNILLLHNVNENVAYATIEATEPWLAALIAFVGAGVGNLLLFIVAVLVLRTKKVLSYVWRYFFLWLVVMNIGNFIAYVPARTFANHGDIYEIMATLNVSPWQIMIAFGYPIIYCIWYFYRKILSENLVLLDLNYASKVVIHLLITFTLFVFFGSAGLGGYGDFAGFTSLLIIYTAPLVAIAFWPARKTPEYWLADK